MEDTSERSRPRIMRVATKIEWSLLVGLVMQAAALIWGAAKLTAGVDQLNENMRAMSDYSVLRYRVEQNELEIRSIKAQQTPSRR
jgi:hypothetical protein